VTSSTSSSRFRVCTCRGRGACPAGRGKLARPIERRGGRLGHGKYVAEGAFRKAPPRLDPGFAPVVGAVRARPDEGSSPGSSKTRWQAGRRELRDTACPYERPPRTLCAASRCHAIEIARLAVYVAAYLRIYVAGVSGSSPIGVESPRFWAARGPCGAISDVLRTARNAAHSVTGTDGERRRPCAGMARRRGIPAAGVEWGPRASPVLCSAGRSFGRPTS
jgi:hypothetical protein